MLDTSVAIHLRDGHPEIVHRLRGLGGPFSLSAITRVELEGGIVSEPDAGGTRRALLGVVLDSVATLPFDDGAIAAYRAILEQVGYSRRKVIDRMIAAQAVAVDATLVTMNGADFQDIPGLKLLAW
jgi:predicted nucleic acid-binding protein